MLREGAGAEAIATYLGKVESDRMGLGSSAEGEKSARSVAAHLVEWYEQEMDEAEGAS
jgi:hypothetical protein